MPLQIAREHEDLYLIIIKYYRGAALANQKGTPDYHTSYTYIKLEFATSLDSRTQENMNKKICEYQRDLRENFIFISRRLRRFTQIILILVRISSKLNTVPSLQTNSLPTLQFVTLLTCDGSKH
jgi:hypothetical protein